MRYAIALLISLGCSSDPTATTPDAPDLPVTVLAAPGRVVIAHDPDGGVLGEASVDAAGRATIVVPAGGSVTCARATDELRAYFTVIDVTPGATIDLRERVPSSTDPRSVMVTYDSFAGAAAYELVPGYKGLDMCGTAQSTTTTLEATFDERCVTADGHGSFVLFATDTVGAALAYALVENASLDAVITAPAWRTDWVVAAGTIANADPSLRAEVGFQSIYEPLFGMFATSMPAAVAHAVVSWSLSTADFSEIVVLQEVRSTGGIDHATLDASDLPPRIATVTRDDSTPARPSITWTSVDPDVSDATIVEAHWTSGATWFVVAGPRTSVRFPDLPDAYRPPGDAAGTAVAAVRGRGLAYDAAMLAPTALWSPVGLPDAGYRYAYAVHGELGVPDLR